MYSINNWDRCLRNLRQITGRESYIKPLTFILVLFEVIRNVDTRTNSLDLL